MIGRNGKGEVVFASNISGEKWRKIRKSDRMLATIVVPEGYVSAQEFADDCGVELVSSNDVKST